MCGPRVGAWAAGRGAHLRRQGGARAAARPKVRGAAALEPRASARGAARGKRAAPMQHRSTTRRSARNARGAPDNPLVALARQFASLSAEARPRLGQVIRAFPARLARGGVSRASTRRAGPWAGAAAQGAAQLRPASSARRTRGRGRGRRAARAATAARGKREAATVAERRRAQRRRAGRWRVRPRKRSRLRLA